MQRTGELNGLDKARPKCAKCDSHEWEGFLHCGICGSYFVFGKCKNCDTLRIQKCPVDNEDLVVLVPKIEET